MLKLLGFLALTGLNFVLLSQPARAVGEEVFVVPRVAVQAQADNASAAKSKAQREGRRRAVDLLLRRLTVEDDWGYLPTSRNGQEGTASQGLSDAELEKLESGFEVYSEKSSSSTYRAFITYRFKPQAVRELLKRSGIPYSEAQTRTALVVPVLQTDSGVYLWEKNNPWMAAWKVRPYSNELTPMTAPLGDLEDAGDVSARQALAINTRALEKLAERYSVPQVIVAHAYLQQENDEDRLRVRFINGFHQSSGIDDSAEFEGADYQGDSVMAGQLSTRFGQAEPGEVLAEAWFSQPSGNFPTLAERAIEGTIAKYAAPWKENTLIDHSVAALLNLSAYYESLTEWAKVREALVSTPLVGSVQVSAFSRGGAEMMVQSFGDPQKLITAMDAQGLMLWSPDGERWNIATPATARRQQAIESRYNSRRSDRGQSSPGVLPAAFTPQQSQ